MSIVSSALVVQQDILAGAQAELDDILLHQFMIPVGTVSRPGFNAGQHYDDNAMAEVRRTVFCKVKSFHIAGWSSKE